MNVLKRWQVFLAILVALITITGAIWKFGANVDARYSKAEACKKASTEIRHEVRLTQQRLDQKILFDRSDQYGQRIDGIEDKAGCHTVPECENILPPDKREIYRHYLKEKKKADDAYEKLGVDIE